MQRTLDKSGELLPAYTAALQQKDYKTALLLCAEIELAMEDTQGFIGSPDNAIVFWISYMAMFLIEGDLDGARYLWKRLSTQVKSNTEITSLWGIGKGLLTRDNVILKQIVSSTTWLHAQPFIADIGDRMKTRQLREIAQAYSVISTVAMGQALLTSSSADTLAIAREYGWDVVDNGEYIRPRSFPMESMEGGNGQRNYAKDVESLQNLSNYVAHFEKKALKIDSSSATSSGSASSSSSSSSAPPLASVPVAMAKKS